MSRNKMWDVNNMIIFYNLCFLLASPVFGDVWYDNKAITINKQRRILLSGSIHYPRSTPEVIT